MAFLETKKGHRAEYRRNMLDFVPGFLNTVNLANQWTRTSNPFNLKFDASERSAMECTLPIVK